MVLSDPIELLIFLAGAVLWLKKLAQMERYQSLRVFVLTAILSYIVLYFTVVCGLTFDYPIETDPNADYFTCSEMYPIISENFSIGEATQTPPIESLNQQNTVKSFSPLAN